jgi:hypothetical protein
MHVLPFDSCTDTRAHARRRQCQLPLSLFVLLPFVDNERDGDHLAILATRRPFFFLPFRTSLRVTLLNRKPIVSPLSPGW